MRLTHVHLCETYSHCTYITNQMACALVNNFSLVICYFNTIFFVYKLITIVTRHQSLQSNDLLRCSLSFALYNIVLLVSSSSPYMKVIFQISTSLEVTFSLSTMEKEVTKLKTKSFLLLISCHEKYICISILVFITVYSYFTLS